MIKPQVPENEAQRLAYLESFDILDTMPEVDYDNLTKIAAEICDVPISLVSLIDDKRQWFKSNHGLNVRETPKELAFCAHAINTPFEPLIVNDSRKDARFAKNPLVNGDPNVIFYAGVPLTHSNGLCLGTLCVIDNKPREISQDQIATLKALSTQVMNLLELRKSNAQLKASLEELEVKNDELEKFAFTAAHDLKSPVMNMSSLSEMFIKDYKDKVDASGIAMLNLIVKSSESLLGLIDGVLSHSQSDLVIKEGKTKIILSHLEKYLSNLLNLDPNVKITLKSELKEVEVNETALQQILTNLITNAIKYNNKEQVEITMSVCEEGKFYVFEIQDNGPGIAPEYQEKIFELFFKLDKYDKFGRAANGVGLATAKKMVNKLGGDIWVNSALGEGACFKFNIKK